MHGGSAPKPPEYLENTESRTSWVMAGQLEEDGNGGAELLLRSAGEAGYRATPPFLASIQSAGPNSGAVSTLVLLAAAGE